MKKTKRHTAKMNILHFHVLIARYFRQIFTTLSTLLPLILEAPVMLMILYVACSPNAFETKDVTQANVSIFLPVVMAALMGILNSYREICKEREILSREVFGGLDVSAYALSKLVVLSAIGAVQCTVLFFGSVPFINYTFSNPVEGYILCPLAMILTNISVTSIGLFISALLKKSESAILPVLLIIIVQVVFSDCLIELSGGAGLFKYITPSTWGIAVFGKLCGLNNFRPAYFHKDLYDLNEFIPVLILIAMTFLFTALTIFKLKRAYRQKD